MQREDRLPNQTEQVEQLAQRIWSRGSQLEILSGSPNDSAIPKKQYGHRYFQKAHADDQVFTPTIEGCRSRQHEQQIDSGGWDSRENIREMKGTSL
jgi:hypothetical protein